MLCLTKADIQSCFSMSEAIAASKEALKIYSQGNANVPLRANLPIEKFEGQSLYMPAATSGSIDAVGVKIVSVYPNNIQKGLPSVPATMIVVDAETGIVSSVMDGTFLTQLRTGAVQGAATDLMARKDAKVATLIGTGGQAYQQALAMLTVRELETMYVFDLDVQRAQTFAEQLTTDLSKEFKTTFIAVEDLSPAIKQSDIITTVTTSKVATFNAEDVKPGTHINGIGSYTPDMKEMPSALIVKADRVIFDTNDGVLAEAGDIISPLEDGLVTRDHYQGELGEVVLETLKGRETDQEITVFKSVGTAVLDVVTAQAIYKKANEKNLGQRVLEG